MLKKICGNLNYKKTSANIEIFELYADVVISLTFNKGFERPGKIMSSAFYLVRKWLNNFSLLSENGGCSRFVFLSFQFMKSTKSRHDLFGTFNLDVKQKQQLKSLHVICKKLD